MESPNFLGPAGTPLVDPPWAAAWNMSNWLMALVFRALALAIQSCRLYPLMRLASGPAESGLPLDSFCGRGDNRVAGAAVCAGIGASGIVVAGRADPVAVFHRVLAVRGRLSAQGWWKTKLDDKQAVCPTSLHRAEFRAVGRIGNICGSSTIASPLPAKLAGFFQ